MAKIDKDDNRSLKESGRSEFIKNSASFFNNKLTKLEYKIFSGFLIQNRTYKDMGETVNLTATRQKQIFENALKRTEIFFAGLDKKLNELEKVKKENTKLQGKLQKLEIKKKEKGIKKAANAAFFIPYTLSVNT